MASMVDGLENAMLLHWFQNANLANFGDATGLLAAGTVGSTQLALATTAFSDTTTALTGTGGGVEVAYTGYSRPLQARTSGGWTVSGDTASNAALIQFGEMSAGGPDTVVHVGLGFMATGDAIGLHQDLTGAGLTVNDGVNPQFSIGNLDWTAA